MAHTVVATAFGGPEVLSLVEEDLPPVRAGDVRLAVRAAGINPDDWKVYSGMMGTDAPLPMRLGYEAAGVVVEAGPDATGPAGPVSVGDEVIAFRIGGGYADELVVPATAVVPKPIGMRWEEAGGLMLAGATAMHALAAAQARSGETVLVHAAAGGVGLMVVQIARARAVRVSATASARNHARLRALGAEPTAYGVGLADRVRALAPGGVDAAIDCVGTDEAVDVSLELVVDPGRVVSIAAFGRGDTGIRLIGGGRGADPGTELRDAARLQLTRLFEQGHLTVDARAFGLDRAADAHREGRSGHVSGKLVLVPGA